MKKIIKASIESLLAAALTILILIVDWMGLHEMFTEGYGWYTTQDYFYTTLLILLLSFIAYVSTKFIYLTWYNFAASKRNISTVLILEEVIEEGLAYQAALEENIYNLTNLFTPEQAEQYYKNLKEVK